MSATVAAALKKIAVAILTDKKALKTVGGIILGILIIICLPVVSIISILNGDIQFDEARLQQIVVQNLSAEEQIRLQAVEDTMYAIDTAMRDRGFDAQRVKEAQVLYVLALSDCSGRSGFVQKLVGCFAEGQSDSQLIAAVNVAFGKEIDADEFSKIMNTIRAVYISTSGYVDPYTKNNLDLVTWAKNAKEKGWGYVWGTYGSVLTRGLYNAKEEQYPDEVGGYADFIKSHWLGGRTADCVGLIKGYGWLDPDDHEVHYGTNGMPDIGADAMYYNASEKGSISTIPEIPGLAVWKSGHIGIYIGNGQVIHASGTMIGVIQSPLGETGWTHWLKIPYITYLDSKLWQHLKRLLCTVTRFLLFLMHIVQNCNKHSIRHIQGNIVKTTLTMLPVLGTPPSTMILQMRITAKRTYGIPRHTSTLTLPADFWTASTIRTGSG